jgi:hypothetical protein
VIGRQAEADEERRRGVEVGDGDADVVEAPDECHRVPLEVY